MRAQKKAIEPNLEVREGFLEEVILKQRIKNEELTRQREMGKSIFVVVVVLFLSTGAQTQGLHLESLHQPFFFF
jgi:hypothetical protein